jgi:uncharacterized OB-fold protein
MKKVCSGCKFEKDLVDFYETNGAHQNYCKICLLTFQKDRWRSRKAKATALFGGKCVSCGYCKNLAAFDFHHVNPAEKEFNWGRLKQKSWDKVILELQKCILLCKNCHAELHHPQLSVDEISEDEANRLLTEERLLGFAATGACPKCGAEVFGTKYCGKQCSHESQRKVHRPNKEQLEQEIKTTSWTALGKKYGVSDNAVRKWARHYNLRP